MRPADTVRSVEEVEAGEDRSLLAWCVAAETTHGPWGRELRPGLKHFSAGAKVWVLPPQWGDGGDSVFVIGRHRGGHRRGYIRMVIQRRRAGTPSLDQTHARRPAWLNLC